MGETLLRVQTPTDVAKLARTVEANRSARSHLINDRSSRSHCLVKVQRVQTRAGARRTNRFLFVDLAGSERIGRTGMTQGVGKSEATEINGSLLVLGRVVKQLAQRVPHVSFRDSTLTKLLRDSLEGRAAVTFVVCVAAGARHADETACSLQ